MLANIKFKYFKNSYGSSPTAYSAYQCRLTQRKTDNLESSITDSFTSRQFLNITF